MGGWIRARVFSRASGNDNAGHGIFVVSAGSPDEPAAGVQPRFMALPRYHELWVHIITLAGTTNVLQRNRETPGRILKHIIRLLSYHRKHDEHSSPVSGPSQTISPVHVDKLCAETMRSERPRTFEAISPCLCLLVTTTRNPSPHAPIQF